MMKTKFWTFDMTIILALLSIVSTGGAAYGTLVTKQDAHEARLVAVEDAPVKIAAIEASQKRMEEDIREIKQDQRVILQAVSK